MRLNICFAVLLFCIIGGQQLVVFEIGQMVRDPIEARLDEIAAKTRDRWTRTDHDNWVKELKRLNPNLVLP